MQQISDYVNNHPLLIRSISLVLLLVIAVFFAASEMLWGNAKRTQIPVFGITYHTELRFDKQKTAFQREEILKDLVTIRELGVDLVRTDVSWQRVPIGETPALEFDSWFAAQVHLMGMKLMFVLKTPEQITLYSSLLQKADYLQVANEPNSVAFSVALGSTDPLIIINKLVSNFHLIEAYSPDSITVLNPVDLPKIPGVITTSWIDLYQALAKNEIAPSIVGIDCYPGGPYQWGYPLELARSVAITRQSLAIGDTSEQPVWIIETGSPTYQRTLVSQSDYIKAVVKAVALSGTNGLIIYEAFDNSEVVSEVTEFHAATSLVEANFGLFYENRTPKPAALEYERLIKNFRSGLYVTEISLSQIAYVIFSAVFRLMMPSGGPMVLAELMSSPKFLFIVLGLVVRVLLGIGLLRSDFKLPFIDIVIAAGILLFFSLFQILSNTQLILWQLQLFYLIVFFLFLWSGTSQIALLSATQMNTPIDYFYPFLPLLFGFALAALMGMPTNLWFLIPFVETFLLVGLKTYYWH
jgi:hypothetical protein